MKKPAEAAAKARKRLKAKTSRSLPARSGIDGLTLGAMRATLMPKMPIE
jgi:hypothetical protein